MVRTDRAALAVGNLLRKAVVGFLGVMVVVVAIVPMPEPDRRTMDGRIDPASPADTVILAVPDGSPAGTLTVVDPSGRKLAMLTHWINDDMAIVTPRRNGANVGYYLNPRGSAVLLLAGTARQTRIEMRPDGTTKTLARDHPVSVEPTHTVPLEAGVGEARPASETSGSANRSD